MIGLIFGETNFPIEILKKIKKKHIKYLIIDLSRRKIFKKDKNSHAVSMGQFGKIVGGLRARDTGPGPGTGPRGPGSGPGIFPL